MQSMAKKTAVAGMLVALSFIFSYVETLIPVSVIPGVKLGLANIIILFALYKLSPGYAILINIIRIILASILFTGFMAFTFALGGALLSFIVMYLTKRYTKLHIVTISELGALFHMFGQLLIGTVWYPLPVIIYNSIFILISSAVSGIVMGIIADIVIKKTKLTLN